jgi:hypothetical protein
MMLTKIFSKAFLGIREARAIRFCRRKEVLGSIDVEDYAPKLTVQAPRMRGRGKAFSLHWKGVHDKPLTYAVRYSHDEGNTWQVVGADLKEEQCAVNTELLPGGRRCVFQVLASAGVRTTIVQSEPFAVPQKPRQAYILSPKADLVIPQGEPLLFKGGGHSPDFWRTDLSEGEWRIGNGEILGRRYEFIIRSLPAGRHEIKFSIPDGLGGTSSTTRYIEVEKRKAAESSGRE